MVRWLRRWIVGKYQQLKDIEVYVLARRLADRVWNEVCLPRKYLFRLSSR